MAVHARLSNDFAQDFFGARRAAPPPPPLLPLPSPHPQPPATAPHPHPQPRTHAHAPLTHARTHPRAGCEPEALRARLQAGGPQREEATALAHGLQRLLSTYSGVMLVGVWGVGVGVCVRGGGWRMGGCSACCRHTRGSCWWGVFMRMGGCSACLLARERCCGALPTPDPGPPSTSPHPHPPAAGAAARPWRSAGAAQPIGWAVWGGGGSPAGARAGVIRSLRRSDAGSGQGGWAGGAEQRWCAASGEASAPAFYTHARANGGEGRGAGGAWGGGGREAPCGPQAAQAHAAGRAHVAWNERRGLALAGSSTCSQLSMRGS